MLSVLTFRTPEEAVEKANNTPYGLSAGVWTEKGSRILWMAERLRAGVVWANTFNRFDPASPFGGYKESGFGREGGRHGLEPYLAFDRLTMARLPVRKTYKLFIGGAFPRSESGRTYEAQGQNVARASRKDARDAVVAARAAQPALGGRDRLQPRPGALPDRRDDGGAGRRVRRALRAAATRSSGRSTAGSGTPGSPTSSPQVLGSANPVAGPYFNFTVPEPTGVVAIVAPEEPPLLGLVSRIAPALVGGNAVVARRLGGAARSRRSSSPRRSRRATCPAGRSTC